MIITVKLNWEKSILEIFIYIFNEQLNRMASENELYHDFTVAGLQSIEFEKAFKRSYLKD